MERDRGRRFNDGEVVRYGAGESWRPTPRGGAGGGSERERSPPRRPRSPARDRDRSRARSPRPRSPVVSGSDSYVPGRYAPRRRSQSRGPPVRADTYRRERSRDRESPRRRERTRSPARSPRRSLSRRGTGTPRRASPGRGDRYERPRSPPRREWNRDRDLDRDRARDRDADRDRDWRDRDRSRTRDRDMDRRDDRRDDRRRSRSPFGRDRRDRSPMDRGTPPGAARGGSYRPSRSPSRRGERYSSYRRTPPRDSGLSSTLNSQPTSQRGSPHPGSIRNRSPLPSGDQSPALGSMPRPGLSREPSRTTVNDHGSAPRSPPRGPAALRAPPTGPAASRSYSNSSPAPHGSKNPPNPQTPAAQPRSEVTSPTNAPSGPRGYVSSSRGAYSSRGGRGTWNQTSSRHMGGPSPSPSTPTGPSSIPTGPRAAPNAPSSSTPTQGRPFNPPTGPAAGPSGGPRQSLAHSLLSTMPPIIPGGKLDPSMTPVVLGVSKELEPHYRKLRDEEEKLREELRAKQERLRKSLYMWDRLGRESRAWELRSDLSEKSMKNLAGEGMGGAAF